jgi:hypothetical protein
VEDFLTAGISTGKQLRITGVNLAGGGGTPINNCYLLPNPGVPEKSLGFTFLPPSDPLARDGSVVVALGILPFFDGDPLVSGVANFALERSDGQTTNVVEIGIEPPPPPTDGRPFINGVAPLSVARGDIQKQVNISGVRLTNVSAIEFENPGITVTSILPVTGGFQMTIFVDVAADAVLSGDAATNFQVNTNHGKSPKAGLIVTP